MLGTTLGALDIFPLGIYDVMELVSLEGSNGGAACSNFEVLMLGDGLGLVVGFGLGSNKGDELVF